MPSSQLPFENVTITTSTSSKTTAKMARTETTISEPTEVIFEGNVKFAMEWHPALQNKSSDEYKNISNQFLMLMNSVYKNGELKSVYIRTEIISITRGSIDIKYNQIFKDPEVDLSNGTVIEVTNTTVIDVFEKGIEELEKHSSNHTQALAQTFNITHAKIVLRELPQPKRSTPSPTKRSSIPQSTAKTTKPIEVTETPENTENWIKSNMGVVIGASAGAFVLLIVVVLIIRRVRKPGKDAVLWDDSIGPTFTKLDQSEEYALSATNPTYTYTGGKLEIDNS
ncbi:uncharacterized protein LOC133203539 [Saccostrea echinata]|uniref:uncharacterized protein LOC133203539 n=1 Tax=Saccostrea echinata TaxID=191078 RepID=UPI002A81FD3E|nr:uncharacterized protein LOC133203539 [Saccostrea echinata]